MFIDFTRWLALDGSHYQARACIPYRTMLQRHGFVIKVAVLLNESLPQLLSQHIPVTQSANV